MTAAVEKKKNNKQKAFHSAKDYETSASQIGGIEPIEESAKDKARKVAAQQLLKREPDATAADLKDLLMMLGLHPSQPDWDDGPSTTPTRTPSPKGP